MKKCKINKQTVDTIDKILETKQSDFENESLKKIEKYYLALAKNEKWAIEKQKRKFDKIQEEDIEDLYKNI